MDDDFYEKVDDAPEKKGSVWPGLIVSIIMMIASLAVIGPVTFSVTPEELGGMAFYCILGVVATTVISKLKKLNIAQVIALSLVSITVAIVIGFMTL